MERKVGYIVNFLNELKNRGTKVSSRTSGPSVVISVVDFKDSLEKMIVDLVKFGEFEISSREEQKCVTKRALNDKAQSYMHYTCYLESLVKDL